MERNLIEELINVIMNGGNFDGEINGCKISASRDGNNVSIEMTKNMEDDSQNTVQKEVDEFNAYCETIPDEMFLSICENLADDNLNRIQECINSNDLESVRSGIIKFKKAVNEYINDKIDEINEDRNAKINYYKQFYS